MTYEAIRVPIWETQWRCVELRKDNVHLHYGRFYLAPLLLDQADLIGSVMRKALLAELEGTRITYVKLMDVAHQYSIISGVKEPVYDLVMNLKKVVLRNNQRIDNPLTIFKGRLSVKGPAILTAKDILFSDSAIEVVDNNQYIATVTESVRLTVDLIVERKTNGERGKLHTFQEGSYPVGNTFSPVLNANYSIHYYPRDKKYDTHSSIRDDNPYIRDNPKKEVLFLEIWTNGSLTPVEALDRTCQKLAKLFTAPLRMNEKDNQFTNKDHFVVLSSLTCRTRWERIRHKPTKVATQSIFIDQFEFTPKIYNGLKKADIKKLYDVLNHSYEDLMKIEFLGLDDVKKITSTIADFLEVDSD
uniref:DNA-directed RNA polymerase n=1 Tax=Amphilophium dolichoides TaxID=2358312 RepID=A0A4P9HQU8_9LAMI|nr:RNA polymerase alpha subunit [Amphilophium dolichoides]YP_009662693.1 RNA polymerase alpha subunit [Amphilophium dolichoides]QCU48172.1 RNA polymerase alpha subunit [Amphilophium dolichoides]QCU48215.1 RNA polymerase alpha subunit [Amphilophium dolichoides]